jgi:predicted ferric reductase
MSHDTPSGAPNEPATRQASPSLPTSHSALESVFSSATSSRRSEQIRRIEQALGGTGIVALTLVTVLLWLLLRPAGPLTGMYLGEMVGTTAIVLLSCSLVLATKAPALERFFGGLDQMYVWHRWAALAGTALLPLHYFLVTSLTDPIHNSLGNALGYVALVGLVILVVWALIPRVPLVQSRLGTNYLRWLSLHRLAGLFVIVGLIHAVLVDPVLRRSPLLLGWYAAIASVGVVAYLYRELLNPFLRVLWRHDYRVETITRMNPQTVEVALTPVGRLLPFVAGQFGFVRFGGGASWEPHPFTISSAPHERLLLLTIKGLGDYTSRLVETLQPGTPARIGLASGLFNYRTGGREQVWIAGGIGITPFRSWIRDFEREPPSAFDIDLYYTVHNEQEALFLDEITRAAAQYLTFRPHMIYSKRARPLTVEQIAASSRGPLQQKEFFLCGPQRLIGQFRHTLQQRGVPSHHIHFERFNFR